MHDTLVLRPVSAFKERIPLLLIRFKNTVPTPVLVAVAYFVGAEAAFLIGTLSDRIFAPFWPPNVVLFCALLLAPERRWWLYLIAVFPAHVLAELQVGMPAAQMLVSFATNCCVAILNSAAVRRILGDPPWPAKLRTTSYYILVTAVVSPAICALGGAFVPILGGGALENYLTYWGQWYLSNALGSLTLGPLFLTWLSDSPRSSSVAPPHRQVEAVILGGVLAVVCAAAFHFRDGAVAIGFVPTLLYSPLPLILWSAMRFGEKGASAAILIVAVVLLWRTLNSSSVFIAGEPELNVLALQTFLIALAIPVLLLGASIDEARHAEQAIRENEERMGLAAASANIGLWHYDPATEHFWATDHCRSMFGLAHHVALTRHALISAIHPEDREAALEAMKAAANSEQPTISEFRTIPVGGQTRWIRARAYSHYGDRGSAARLSGILVDITDYKTAEAETELQRREVAHLMRVSVLGELSGAIAHELNQPLTAILANAQAALLALAQTPADLAEVKEALEEIELEDSRAGAVIHRLRDLLGKGQSQSETIDINELIESTLQLLRGELISRRIIVKMNLAEWLPSISGDPVQLQQVMLNLVMNAMDAMHSTPLSRRAITVCTSMAERDQIEVVVADRGAGIAPKDRALLFKPFFTTKEHGLGLGLSICSTIVNSHGGKLALRNNNDDGGAMACFTLPTRMLMGTAK
jgi:PAS domain S-box-containing protein